MEISYVISDSQLQHWITKYGWRESSMGEVFITNQEENIKTKNITEKITFESKFYHSIQIC